MGSLLVRVGRGLVEAERQRVDDLPELAIRADEHIDHTGDRYDRGPDLCPELRMRNIDLVHTPPLCARCPLEMLGIVAVVEISTPEPAQFFEDVDDSPVEHHTIIGPWLPQWVLRRLDVDGNRPGM